MAANQKRVAAFGTAIIVVVAMFVPALSAGAAVASTQGSLTVRVLGLPGVGGRVDVYGPNGFHRRVGKTKTLKRLVPGPYSAKVADVHKRKVLYHGVVTGSPVDVTAGHTAAIDVNYPTSLPDTTKALSDRDLAAATVSPDLAQISFTVAPTDVQIRTGDVLTSGRTAGAPYGLLRRVTAVTRQGTGLVVTTTSASLTDAVPRGTFTTSGDVVVEPPASAASLLVSAAAIRPASVTVGGDVLGSVGTEHVACGGGGGVSVTPHLSGLSFHHDFTPTWDAGGLRVDASIQASATVSATIETSGVAGCSFNAELIKPFPVGPSFPVLIPGTPIVLYVTPKLGVDFSLAGSVDRSISYTVSRSRSFSAGFHYANHHVQAFNADGSASATDDLPESDAVGKVEWSVTPNLEFEIDGVGGPTFGIATGNAAEYNPTSDGPTWQISDELGGVVGLKAGFFGLIDADIEAPVLTYSQVVRASAPKIDTSSPLPAGTVGTAYSQQLRAKGGPEGPCGSGKQCQYHWSIDPASLAPSWVTITSDGMLHIDAPYGTSPGPVTFTVDVADDASFNNGNPIPISTGHADLTVQLDAAKSGPVSIALPTIPDGVQYLQYQGAALQATSPGAPSFFLWQVAGGALPDGLRLGFFDGTISGTPTVSGDFPVTISATDSNGVVGQVSLTMHVNSDACSAVCAIPLGGSRVAVTWQGCNCAVVSGSFVYHLKEYGNGIWGGRFTNPFYLELLDRDLRTLPDGRVLWTGNVSFMTQPGDSYFVQEALVTVGPAPDYTRGDATATWRTSNTIVIK